MANLTEKRVREIAKEEVNKVAVVDIHKIAERLFELQRRQKPGE